MNKKEFEQLIKLEVANQIKLIVPKLVKPLVQEAVAGALANILAEGIVKGPPVSNKILTPNITSTKPVSHSGAKPAKPNGSISASDRRRLASKFESLMDSHTEPTTTGNVLRDILNETASNLNTEISSPSVLDSVEDMDGAVPPSVVGAITRDYSDLMAKMKEKGTLRG